MADYAPNYSPRYVFQYQSAGQVHSQTVRVARGFTRNDAGVTSKLAVVASTLAAFLLTDFAYLSGTYYDEDEFIGLPIDLGDLTEVAGTNVSAITTLHTAIQTRFECRGNGGGRGSISFFGLNFLNWDGDSNFHNFRITPAEIPAVGSCITALSELSPQFVPLGSTLAFWRSYANVKYNDYWVNQVRS